MRLKQLKLAGFKSFANPTTFHFPKTITAIVGPNGCGKSNVIDAIRWVLGESSAKQLRGGAMSDVIFAGTQEKPAKSLASVELVFEHTQGDESGKGGIHHPLNLYHELSVRRQINKDGKSDYFINGTKVRRRDVVDIFLGTGLGARSYAVIEQGMIGRIIDANALQLREFIEEASGVSRYQSRREDTQKQLTIAQDNLARLHDMASELSAQQKRLAIQAKTAQQAQTWQSQLEDTNQQLLIDDYGQAWHKQQALAKDYQAISAQVAKQQAVIAELNNNQQASQRDISEQQLAYQAGQNLVQRHWQQHHEAQSLLTQSEQSLANDQQRLNTLNFELNRFADYTNELSEQQSQAQARITELPQQVDAITERLTLLRDSQSDLKQQRQAVATSLVKLNQQKTEQEKQLAVSNNALKHHDSQQQRLTKRQSEQQQALNAWQVAKAKFDQEFADFDDAANAHDSAQQLAKLNDRIERLEARIIARQEELADQTDDVDSLTRQLRQAEQQRHTWSTEQNTLQNLLDQQAQRAKTAQTRGNQTNASQLPKLVATLTLTEQGKAYAPIFDTLVSVFQHWSIAEIKQLTAQSAILSGETGILFDTQPTQGQTAENLGDAFICLADLIATPSLPLFKQIWLGREAIADSQLPEIPLGQWLLWQDNAQNFVLANQQIAINLTQLLSTDKKDNTLSLSHQFSHQARIDELQALLDRHKPQLDRVNAALQEASVSLQEWQAQDRSARQELTQLTQQKHQLTNANLQREHRYQAAFDKLQADKQRIDNDERRLAEEQQSLTGQSDLDSANVTALQQALRELQPQLQQQISERQSLDTRLQALANEQRELEQQQQRLNQTIATGQLQISASTQQLIKAQQDQARISSEHSQLEQKIAQQTERLPQLREQVSIQAQQLEQANANLAKLAEQLQLLEQRQQQAQTTIQEAQAVFANLQQQQHTTDTAQALAQQNVQLIGEQLREREIALPEVSTLELLNKPKRKELQQQANQLKTQISGLGAVNHAAVAELDAVNQRLEPLAEQITDLTESIDKLQQAIKQIDSQTKSLFLGMLKDVNLELNRLFTEVFGGGKAELILTDEDGADGWQSGLELMAQPKGKKNSRLALLSGGEKTLTALSLVFAIFKQQPAPFCVLDEVDAPLDDANVERFTRLIEQLARDVQFIFISHNKLSMQIANELKGVTMPTAGVSKLVSVDMFDVANYLES